MPKEAEKVCGCKGIRTCLLCEEIPAVQKDKTEHEHTYVYCYQCGFCWSKSEDAVSKYGASLYLGKIQVYEDFVTEEEESIAICEIDKIPWVPSQSGRRKQDFGPKVNFKKKKIKIGDFKGFPSFTKSILEKFKKIPELLDFQAVELCHLEYTPERGSSIDPHVDDFWLWGERLVTINLSSTTILTLVPFSNSNQCSCLEEAAIYYSTISDLNSVSINKNQNISSVDNASNHLNSVNCYHLNKNPTKSCNHRNSPQMKKSDFCSMFRIGTLKHGVSVQVELPPRSLLILSGCARYNWHHEIKRKDVTSRRVAMTFRELSSEFLAGGKEDKLGQELLSVGRNFYDFN